MKKPKRVRSRPGGVGLRVGGQEAAVPPAEQIPESAKKLEPDAGQEAKEAGLYEKA